MKVEMMTDSGSGRLHLAVNGKAVATFNKGMTRARCEAIIAGMAPAAKSKKKKTPGRVKVDE